MSNVLPFQVSRQDVRVEIDDTIEVDPEIERRCHEWHHRWKRSAIKFLGDLYSIVNDLPMRTPDQDTLLDRVSDLNVRIVACRWTGDRKFAYQLAFNDEVVALCWDCERSIRQS